MLGILYRKFLHENITYKKKWSIPQQSQQKMQQNCQFRILIFVELQVLGQGLGVDFTYAW